MQTSASQLLAAMTALETAAGGTTAGNATDSGRWKRIAAAAETLAGATSTANATPAGYMLRTAVALEVLSGTDGTAENRNESGLLKRIVDALEALGEIGVGSLAHRFVLAAEGASFAPPVVPEFVSSTAYDNGAGVGNWTPFTDLDLSGADVALVALFVGANETPGATLGNFTRIGNGQLTNGISTSGRFALYRCIAPGTETFTTTGITTGTSKAILLLVNNADSVAISAAGQAASGTAPNPPSVDGGAVHDTLWVELAAAQAANIIAASTGYTLDEVVNYDVVTSPGSGIGAAYKQGSGQVEDPDAMTSSAGGRNCAFTLAAYMA